MWDEARVRAVLARVMERANGPAEAWLGGGRFDVTRFAQNSMTQHVSEADMRLSLRLIDGDRTGRATSNRLDDSGIADCVTRARENTRAARPLPGMLPLQPAVCCDPLPVHDADTAAMTPEQRAVAVNAAIEACRERDLKASGIYQADESSFEEYEGPTPMAIANSAGHVVFHRRTRAVFSITVQAGAAASGWAQASSYRAADFDPLELTRTAIDKALASRDPVDVPAGETTVLLEPEAVSNLLVFLQEGFAAAAVDEGRSFLDQPSGQKIFGEKVTLTDDVRHARAIGVPFDREGVPRRRVLLVDRGVHKGLLHSRASAARHNVEPTGHGLGVPSMLDALPACLVMDGADRPFSDLVAETPRALLVTRFWYCRLVDKKKVIVTGMTRDGTFQVEGGRIVRAVRNMRFNMSVLDLLRQVEALSRQALHSGCVVPGLRVRGFRFTSTTRA